MKSKTAFKKATDAGEKCSKKSYGNVSTGAGNRTGTRSKL